MRAYFGLFSCNTAVLWVVLCSTSLKRAKMLGLRDQGVLVNLDSCTAKYFECDFSYRLPFFAPQKLVPSISLSSIPINTISPTLNPSKSSTLVLN
jgi:hypothetical protein